MRFSAFVNNWAALAVIATVSQVQAQQTSDRFGRWDANKDGKVTREEMPAWFKDSFDAIDTNKDGVITSDEEQKFRPTNPQGPNAQIPNTVRSIPDLPYAATDNPKQRLDLYLPKSPKSDKPLPLVVFVHGGAWRVGDKRTSYFQVAPFLQSGDYAAACISYRLVPEAIWPAQIYDCKAAIRWLRANAKDYNIDPDKIGVMGTSSGGHLVALLGTSGDVPELEGKLGDNLNVSSRVTCVVDQFGHSDFLALGGGANDPTSPIGGLLGGGVQDKKYAARESSPITFVSKDDPPFLILHGTNDPAIPFKQSEILLENLKKAGVDAMLVPVTGGGHGDFGTQEVPNRAKQFFDKHLRGQDVTVSSEPIKAGPPTQKNNKKG
ncbi:MAG TPA: alpha/beta hydrolase fold domain-containing protein [Pirellulaceae bacterium]